MRGVAAPIFDASALAVAAVGVVGPVQRLSLARQRALAREVMRTAQTVSALLGHAAG